MAIDAQDYPRVIAGLSRSKNGVASLAYDPAIHEEAQQASTVRFDSLRGFMDARVKPAHDAECVAPLQQRRPR
jgi:hypothetical protein